MSKADENVLDLDALIGDAPVITFKDKPYKFDPPTETVMKAIPIWKATEADSTDVEKMKQLIAVLLPDFPQDELKRMRVVFPIVSFLTKQISKMMGLSDIELREIAEKAERPFGQSAPSGDTS